MAITNYTEYLAKLSAPHEVIPVAVGSLTTAAGRLYDLWTSVPPVGVAPTTAVAPTRATTGAFGQQDSTTGTLGIVSAQFNAMSPGCYILADRLSHQGGLSGTTTGAQTTNLPTAALTRYTDGEGVMAMLTIYTQVGTTGTTATISYTNQANTSGQTSPLVVFGGTGFREAGRAILLPFASGDTGIRAVASVTLAASTATAGAFGVTLFKPLAAVICNEQHGASVADIISGRLLGGLEEIVDDACLFLLAVSMSTNVMGTGAFQLSEW